MYRQRKEIRTDSKKESKSGQRKQKVATRIALSKRLRVPASKLKGKTFEELMDLSKLVNSGDIEGAKELLEVQEMAPRISDKEMERREMMERKYEIEEKPIFLSRGISFDRFRVERVGKKYEEDIEEKPIFFSRGISFDRFRVERVGKKYEEEEEVDDSVGIISNFMTKVVPTKRAKIQKVRPPSQERPPPIRPDLSQRFYDEGKYDYLDYEDEQQFKPPKEDPPLVPLLRRAPAYSSQNDARIDDERIFRDNMIREINSGLTGLELNPNIPVTERNGRMNRIRDVIDEDEQKIEQPLNDNGEPILEQNNELEGPVDELIHADPNDDRTQLNVGVARLAENNQYSDQQKLFLQRNEANRRIQNRIKKGNLDMNLGRAEVPLGERDDEEKYGDQDDFGGGLGDMGPDLMDDRVTENSRSNRELIENAIERQTLQPRARWTGNRSVTADFQRQSVADRIGSSLSNSQALNSMRASPIPWKRPSRTYANNYVGLVRNSNRSMILAVNRLEA